LDFWQQLKPGYDDFEERRQEITYAVRDKRYMVQAQAPAPKKEEQQPSLFDGMFSQRKYLLP
jgi:murein L,D-transpeptidase YafK